MKMKLVYRILSIMCVMALLCANATFAATDAQESDRVVKIYKKDGYVTIERDGQSITNYAGLKLQSGDKAIVGRNSFLYIQLDDDKYVMAGPSTTITLDVSGTKDKSKTNINLLYGSIMNRVDNKLGKDSSYVVTAGDTAMEITGTLVGCKYMTAPTGTETTSCPVFEGNVTMQTGEPIFDGKKVGVAQNEECKISIAPNGDVNVTKDALDYTSKNYQELCFIKDSLVTGRQIGIDEKYLDELIALKKIEAEEKAREEEAMRYYSKGSGSTSGSSSGAKTIDESGGDVPLPPS